MNDTIGMSHFFHKKRLGITFYSRYPSAPSLTWTVVIKLWRTVPKHRWAALKASQSALVWMPLRQRR